MDKYPEIIKMINMLVLHATSYNVILHKKGKEGENVHTLWI